MPRAHLKEPCSSNAPAALGLWPAILAAVIAHRCNCHWFVATHSEAVSNQPSHHARQGGWRPAMYHKNIRNKAIKQILPVLYEATEQVDNVVINIKSGFEQFSWTQWVSCL